MALPYPITASQTDAKSPVDEQLMDAIRLDLEYLETQLNLQGSFDYQFKVNGKLSNLPTYRRSMLDGVNVANPTTFQRCRAYLEYGGTGGTLDIDVRAFTPKNILITGLARQFSNSINTIARAGSSLSTQSITRAASQIATQSVTQWKSSINVTSVVKIDSDSFRYNLASAPDSDWKVGDYVTFASMSNSLNNGTFPIARINVDGGNNIEIVNASGVVQTTTAGNAVLAAWSYNFVNPVSTQFAAGEAALFASHSVSGNNGALVIYAINQAGNNIIVKNALGAAEGSGGTADTNRFIFAFSTAASATDYIVGEKALTAGHSNSLNNGSFYITAVNNGGNNVILYNVAGVVQGGSGGTVDTNRWVYFFSSDPSTGVTAGEYIVVTGATTSANNGTFVAKQVNRTTSDNVVVYNESGASQASASGTLYSLRMLVKFASDQSASITTASKIKTYGTSQNLTDGYFQVLEVNRGGGSNYNAVIESALGVEQGGAAGRVVLEGKSIFTTRPSITIPASTTSYQNTHYQVSSNAVINSTTATVTSGTLIAMDILSIPGGEPKNLVVQLL